MKDFYLNYPLREEDCWIQNVLAGSYISRFMPRAFERGVPYVIKRVGSRTSCFKHEEKDSTLLSESLIATGKLLETRNVEVVVPQSAGCLTKDLWNLRSQNRELNSCSRQIRNACDGVDGKLKQDGKRLPPPRYREFVCKADFIILKSSDKINKFQKPTPNSLGKAPRRAEYLCQEYAKRGFDLSCLSSLDLEEEMDECEEEEQDVISPQTTLLQDDERCHATLAIYHILSLHNFYGLTPNFPVMFATYRSVSSKGNVAQILVLEAVCHSLDKEISASLQQRRALDPYRVCSWLFQVLFSLTLASTTVGFSHRNLNLKNVGLLMLDSCLQQDYKQESKCDPAGSPVVSLLKKAQDCCSPLFGKKPGDCDMTAGTTVSTTKRRLFMSYWRWCNSVFGVPLFGEIIKITNLDQGVMRLSESSSLAVDSSLVGSKCEEETWRQPFNCVRGHKDVTAAIAPDLANLAQCLRQSLRHRVDVSNACNLRVAKHIDQTLQKWTAGQISSSIDEVSKTFSFFVVPPEKIPEGATIYEMPPPNIQ